MEMKLIDGSALIGKLPRCKEDKQISLLEAVADMVEMISNMPEIIPESLVKRGMDLKDGGKDDKITEWKNKNMSICAYTFPHRKKPCLCIRKGQQITQYGQFNDAESADAFMNQLGEFIGAKFDEKME